MTLRMSAVQGIANTMPHMYVDAIIVGVVSYFGFKVLFHIIKTVKGN
jgi:hypothetical protein